MSKYLKDYTFLFTIAGLLIAFDQWTKYLVRTYIPFGGQWAPWDWLLPYARFVHWSNKGAAFGMFQDLSVVFAVLSLIVSAAIIYYFPRVPGRDWWLRLAMAMQCGGAVGNLIDRLTQGGQVTDFISVGSFAVFNVADSCISVGVVVLVIGMWVKEREQQKAQAALPSSETMPPTAPAALELPSPDSVEEFPSE